MPLQKPHFNGPVSKGSLQNESLFSLKSSRSSIDGETGDTTPRHSHDSDGIHPFQIPVPKEKKRHLFRFGRKKSQSNIANSIFGVSNGNHTPLNDSKSILGYRKKSRDYENSIFAPSHLDMTTHDDTSNNERKRSSSSTTTAATKKGKDRKKSEGSIYFMSDEGQMGKGLEFDQDFDSLDGIVNTEYRHVNPRASTTFHPVADPTAENWTAPDSWAVQPPELADGIQTPRISKDNPTDYFPVVEQDSWNVPSKNYCIRIFRPDGTFGTLNVPLNTTTSDLIQRLAGKFFLHDLGKYRVILTRHNLDRVLLLNEHPVQMQKILLDQIGYTEEDKIEDVGREDNSYLFRFTFGPRAPQTVHDDEEFSTFRRVDLQARNLLTVPIFLYKYASRIASLDLSKNLMMEIPVDFVQMCKGLKQLWITNNDYFVVPSSIKYIPALEHLNISNNQIASLEQACLEDIITLKTMRAYNNRLESLPDSFQQFMNLTILFISNNFFSKFPMVVCQIKSLAYLDISFNKVSSFPDELGNLTNLVGLFAISNRLSGSLPDSFAKLEKLQELDLRQNQITDLDILSQLPQLEVVSIDYNAVSVINYGFRNLRKFRMSKNHITQFNLVAPAIPALNDMTKCMLTDLNISNCKLTSLPDGLFNHTPNLENLILDHNTLSELPTSIGVLLKLIKLSAQGNNLEKLPGEIYNLGELKILDVQRNNMKSLPKEIWLCVSLQTLNCSSNLLEVFPEPLRPQKSGSFQSQSKSQRSSFDNDSYPSSRKPSFSTFHGSSITSIIPNSDIDMSPVTEEPNSDLINPQLLSSGFHPPPNFNPPSFFASPRNHPPPLSLSLRNLFLGDNSLTDDVWSPLSLFLELRTLNLSFNDLYEIPPDGLCHQHLYELYLSGNQLASLPADDIEKLSYLRVLAVNGNKLQTLPAEIGKLRKLLVLDVGNNVLKYNISNWPYDWNWNWNLSLKYLNLSGNKRLEIKKAHPESFNPKEKNLSDFSALTKLRMLGLMDITILGVSIPDEFYDRRVRTSPSVVNNMGYGVADWLGPNDHLYTWDLVMPRFRNRDDECLFGLFDGRKHTKTGCRLTRFLNDSLTYHLTNELEKTKDDDTVVSAIRRTFLVLEKEFGSSNAPDKELGASGLICYISGTKLYVANVGDALAVISRNNGQAHEITQKHIPLNPSEISRIRAAGGYVSNSGLLNDEVNVSRSFGYYHLIPVINANPYVYTINLSEVDEFIIMGSRGLWDRISYQDAVDIARMEKDDLMVAAQKLRDFALTYGAEDNIMVMVISVADLFEQRDKRLRYLRGMNLGVSRVGPLDGTSLMDDGGPIGTPGLISKNKRRAKDEVPSDSTLARLDREVPPPTNQVALVFTDIKSSTLLWELQPEDMRSAIKIHDAVMRRTLRSIGGYEVKTEGDAFMVCFQEITAALLWCFTVQLQLLEADWPGGILETEEGREIERDKKVIYRGLSVRMGIHWGTPVYERNPITKRMDYFGPVVNKASRICNAADGGQICVSSDVLGALREMPGIFNDEKTGSADMEDVTYTFNRDVQQLKRLGFHVVELGERRLKGLETPEMLSLVYPKQLSGRMEMEKADVLETAEPVASIATIKDEGQPSGTSSPFLRPESSLSMTESSALKSSSRSSSVEDIDNMDDAKQLIGNRMIDPSFVVALSSLALRMEHITMGSVHSGVVDDIYVQMGMGHPGETTTAYAQAFNKRMEEVASDEELLMLMENFVTRIENATSSLFLQKVGRFSTVLEKLGEAIELDPMHILRAIQIYSEVEGLTGNQLKVKK